MIRIATIVTALVRKVPIRIVAAAHDTSVQQIERTYSEKITEHLDAETRKALLLHPEPLSDGTIVTLAGRRRP
jgi:hypothetical protein